MGRSYQRWIREERIGKDTPIVLSLDLPARTKKPIEKLTRILDATHPFICAIKIGRQLTTGRGYDEKLLSLMECAHNRGLPIISDSKLNDVAYTNLIVLRSHLRQGTDAEIVSPLPGWSGGLDVVFEESRKRGKGVLVLGYMSHPGARKVFELRLLRPKMKLYEFFAKRAKEWGADGLVTPATRPKIMRHLSHLTHTPLYAVGIGPQGGEARKAIRAGAEYLIVGRAITRSPNPGLIAERVAREATEAASSSMGM